MAAGSIWPEVRVNQTGVETLSKIRLKTTWPIVNLKLCVCVCENSTESTAFLFK